MRRSMFMQLKWDWWYVDDPLFLGQVPSSRTSADMQRLATSHVPTPKPFGTGPETGGKEPLSKGQGAERPCTGHGRKQVEVMGQLLRVFANGRPPPWHRHLER